MLICEDSQPMWYVKKSPPNKKNKNNQKTQKTPLPNNSVLFIFD